MSGPMKPLKTPAVVMSAHAASIMAVDVVPALLSELQKAEQIILAMLNAMTSAQKSKVHARLDAAGVSGEGMTRHHERRAVLDAAEAMSAPAPSETPPTLTPAELRFVTVLRSMDHESGRYVMAIAARMAEKMPRHTRPKLWLITGGTS
jgi:hypothetical protein